MITQKQSSYKFGIYAEVIVILYLFFSFHKILAHRYKTRFGEIDIISVRGENIIFIEVKARKDKNIQEVLSYNQQKRLSDAASIFLQKNPRYSGNDLRFDLIIFNGALSLKHIKNCI